MPLPYYEKKIRLLHGGSAQPYYNPHANERTQKHFSSGVPLAALRFRACIEGHTGWWLYGCAYLMAEKGEWLASWRLSVADQCRRPIGKLAFVSIHLKNKTIAPSSNTEHNSYYYYNNYYYNTTTIKKYCRGESA